MREVKEDMGEVGVSEEDTEDKEDWMETGDWLWKEMLKEKEARWNNHKYFQNKGDDGILENEERVNVN